MYIYIFLSVLVKIDSICIRKCKDHILVVLLNLHKGSSTQYERKTARGSIFASIFSYNTSNTRDKPGNAHQIDHSVHSMLYYGRLNYCQIYNELNIDLGLLCLVAAGQFWVGPGVHWEVRVTRSRLQRSRKEENTESFGEILQVI